MHILYRVSQTHNHSSSPHTCELNHLRFAMLPSEILDHICCYLDLEALVSLTQTSRELLELIFETTYRDVLLRYCPFYDLDYSQWDSWKASALHFSKVDTRPFELSLKNPIHINTPLPDDFQCFCRGADLKSEIVYEDSGVFIENKFVNLSQSHRKVPPSPILMYIDSAPFGLVHEINYGEESMKVVGDFHRSICTSQIMAAVSTYGDQLGLLMKDLTEKMEDPEEAPLYFARLHGRGPFRLQAVGKRVILVVTGHKGELFSSIFSAPGGFTNLVYTKPLRKLPAGMLFYDGHVYDVFMSLSKKPVVQSTRSNSSTPEEWKLNRYHKVEQDERHTQYALIYNQHGVVSALVDLKEHKIQNLMDTPNAPQSFGTWSIPTQAFGTERHLIFIGISKGAVRIHKYSETYLADRYRGQNHRSMPIGLDVFHPAEEDSTDVLTYSKLNSFVDRFAGLNIPSWPGE